MTQLTPREGQVVALLRRGYSNRDIAEELGISLGGAKYHVSEIISKLGVSNREEAAAWRPQRRWGFAMASILRSWRLRLGLVFASKPLLASAATVTALVVLAGGYGVSRLVSDGGAVPSAGQRLSRSSDACKALLTVQCIGSAGRDFSSLDDAGTVASFDPKMPAYIPEGFQPIMVRHSRPEWFSPEEVRQNCPECDPQMSHNDQIGVYYRDAAGHWLAIVQGFPGALPWDSMSPDLRPAGRQGVVAIGDHGEAYWSRSGPSLSRVVDEHGNALTPQWEDKQLTLYWTVGRVGDGWEISPDGSTVLYGSPFSFSITSDLLSLQELVTIAESVSFD